MDAPSPLAAALAEIRQLHAFFEDWFTGRLERGDDALGRMAGVLDPTFFLVAPSGERLPRARLLRLLADLHGSRPEHFRILVEAAEGRVVAHDHVLATYEEVHRGDGDETRRRSTALFRPDPDAPNGFVWLFVHETWGPAT